MSMNTVSVGHFQLDVQDLLSEGLRSLDHKNLCVILNAVEHTVQDAGRFDDIIAADSCYDAQKEALEALSAFRKKLGALLQATEAEAAARSK